VRDYSRPKFLKLEHASELPEGISKHRLLDSTVRTSNSIDFPGAASAVLRPQCKNCFPSFMVKAGTWPSSLWEEPRFQGCYPPGGSQQMTPMNLQSPNKTDGTGIQGSLLLDGQGIYAFLIINSSSYY
jgi:hypothetical protein